MFWSDPFTQVASTPLSDAITNRNFDGRKKSDKYNEQHFLTSRSDSEETSIGDKIHTVANEYENKIQSKLNNVYEKLKRRFNYKSQVLEPSPKKKEQFNIKNAKATVLINNENLKHKRFNQKTTRVLRHKHKISSTDSNEDESTENNLFLTESDSTVKEKKNTDLEMIEVLEQMLKKVHKSNQNYLMSIAPERTTKLKKNNQRKRNIFNSNGRLAKSFQPTNDNKYDNLAKKIAYDDYVNGYKHYLNFQKRLNQDNFSNTVKFQAHMHHDVNDIGKYILNKIPQTPKRIEKRHLFEDPDFLDDMEVSTKTDENWFRKHFNILLETNAPKKKFHSSQTVNLKPPTKVYTISNTKVTTNAPKNRMDTTATISNQIESSKDGEKYPIDASGIPATDKVQQQTKFEETFPEDLQITLTEKKVYLKNLGTRRALDKLNGKLNLKGHRKQMVRRRDTNKENNNIIMKAEQIMPETKSEAENNRDSKHEISNVMEKPIVVTELKKLMYMVEENKPNKLKHKKQKRQSDDSKGRLPRFNFLNKLKHIFVLEESTTLGYSNLALDSYLHQLEKEENSPELKDLSIQDILKSLQNISLDNKLISGVEKPYVFKDDVNYEHWYDIDSNIDSSTNKPLKDNVQKTTYETTDKNTFNKYDFEAANNKNEALDKLEADLKDEVLKNLKEKIKNDALDRDEAIRKIEAQMKTEAMNREDLYRDNINNEDENDELKDKQMVFKKINTTPVPVQNDPSSSPQQMTFDNKLLKNQLNEFSKTKEKSAKHIPKTSKMLKKHPHNEKHFSKKTTRKTKAHRTLMKKPIFVAQDQTSTTSIDTNEKTLLSTLKNDALRNKAPKTNASTIASNESNISAKVKEEDETDDNIIKVSDTYDGGNNLNKEVDAEYPNMKSFNHNASDKQYSKGSINTQWITVTKAYDSKPITKSVDAVVKYVSVSNDDRRLSGKNEYANEILTNALKAILEKIDSEKKMKENANRPKFDGTYKFLSEKKDEDKTTISVGKDAESNYDRRLSAEKTSETTAEETEQNTDLNEDSDNVSTQTETENLSLANNQNRARNKKHDDIQAYPSKPYRSYEKQNTMRDDRFSENNNKMSISVEITTNRLEKNQHTPSFDDALYKKLRENELNTKLEKNHVNVSEKLHDYFNDLVIWNGDVLNRETDVVSNFVRSLKTDKQNLDSLKKEVEDIGIYLERMTTTTALPSDVYTLSGIQKYTTMKPILETYQRATEELMLKDDDDRFSFNNAVKAKQSDKSEEAVTHKTPMYMDTTLLAYDGGDISLVMDGQLERQQPRKKSRGSGNSKNKKSTEKKTTRPEQFFTTPVPMTTDDFETFLKDNAIDVETVIAPIYKEPKLKSVVDGKLNAKQRKDDELETEPIENYLRNEHYKIQDKIGKESIEEAVGTTKEDGFEKELRDNEDKVEKRKWKMKQPQVTVQKQIRDPLDKNHNNIEYSFEKGPQKNHNEKNKIDIESHHNMKGTLFVKAEHNKEHKFDATLDGKQIKKDKLGITQNSIDREMKKLRNDMRNLQNKKKNTVQNTYGLEAKTQHANENIAKKVYKPYEPSVKILFKPKRKIHYNFHVKNNGVHFDINSAEVESELVPNDRTYPRKVIQSRRKLHKYKIKITTSRPETNIELYDDENDVYDEGEYENSEWKIVIDSNHTKATKIANFKNKKVHDPYLVKQGFDDNTEDIRAVNITYNLNDVKLPNDIPRKDYFKQTTHPKTANSVSKVLKITTSPNIHNNPLLIVTENLKEATSKELEYNDKIKQKRFRTSWLPFTKHKYTVRTFPSMKLIHPNVMVTQKDNENFMKNALNSIKEMEDATEVLGIFHHRKKTSTEKVYDIVKDIEAFDSKTTKTTNECKDTNSWSSKLTKWTKGFNFGKQQKEKTVGKMSEKHLSTDAIKQIKIRGKIMIYDNCMHTDRSHAHKPSVTEVTINPRWVEFTTRPEKQNVKEHKNKNRIDLHQHNTRINAPAKSLEVSSGPWRDDIRRTSGRRMIKRSRSKELDSTTSVTNGRQERKLHKLKFLPVPEHNWRISHLWAKNNSARKMSAKIKSLPGVKWKPSAATIDDNVENLHKEVELLNEDVEDQLDDDYDQMDIQEANNGTKMSKRSPSKIPLLTAVASDIAKGREEMERRRQNSHSYRKQRDAPSHTVSNVSSIEVIVEMKKNEEPQNESNNQQRQTEKKVNHLRFMNIFSTEPTLAQSKYTSQKFSICNKNSLLTNKINKKNDTEKRLPSTSLSSKVKKVIRAKFANPVNLELEIQTAVEPTNQIKTVDSSAMHYTTNSLFCPVISKNTPTANGYGGISPGIYVLVSEDKDNMSKYKQYVLKPVMAMATQSPTVTRNERLASDTTVAASTVATTPKITKNIGRVTLNRDLIVGLKELLAKLPGKDTSKIISVAEQEKRDANDSLVSKYVIKRQIFGDPFPENDSFTYKLTEKPEIPGIWNEIKRKIGIKSRCPCFCKLNKPMCGMCSASDAVMTELIFELDNIAEFMNNHCREIQNFFILNPKGGQKLLDTVKSLDKQLEDYQNRVKGKCKNDCCCSKFISYWDKRSAVKRNCDDNVPIGKPRVDKRNAIEENTSLIRKVNDDLKGGRQHDFTTIDEKYNNHMSTINRELSFIEEKLTAFIKNKKVQKANQKEKSNKGSVMIEEQQKQKCNKSEPNFELNDLLSKDLKDLNKELEDLMLLNFTLYKKDSSKTNVAKNLYENMLLDHRTKRNVSNYRVETVTINIIGGSQEANKHQLADSSKKFSGKHESLTRPNSPRRENINANNMITKEAKSPNKFTVHKLSTLSEKTTIAPNGDDKYKEYSEVDEAKRKGLLKRLHGVLENYFNVKYHTGKRPSDYCVYNNKPYKIVGPSKRQIENNDKGTDIPSLYKENEESFRKANNDNSKSGLLDAVLKEIIATDCVSRVKDKIARSTEIPTEEVQTQKTTTKIIDEANKMHKTIEEILDFLVFFEKLMKMNNLSDSFHDLILNENMRSEDDNAKLNTFFQASSSSTPNRNLQSVCPKANTKSNRDGNIFSALDPKKLFSKISETRSTKQTKKTNYIEIKPTEEVTTVVYKTNIRNYFTTINLEHTKDPRIKNATALKITETVRHESTLHPGKFVTLAGGSVLNKNLRRITSWGLRKVTAAKHEKQKTTPKIISENRNILLTILMYEAINLSKEFERFSTPDEYLPTRTNSIQQQVVKKTNTETTTAVTIPIMTEINKKMANIKNFVIKVMKNKQTILTQEPAEKQEAITTLAAEKSKVTGPIRKPNSSIIKSTKAGLKSEKTQSMKINAEWFTTTLMNKPESITARPTEKTEVLTDQTTDNYSRNIHVYRTELVTTEVNDNNKHKTHITTLSKQPEQALPTQNMLVKFVQKMMPKKFPWQDNKVEHAHRATIAQWTNKYFKTHPVKTSYDYLTTVSFKSSSTRTEGTKPKSKTEKCEREPSECISDLEATFRHILECHRNMTSDVLERLVRNITCKSYKEAQKQRFIDVTNNDNATKKYDKTGRVSIKWDWIRNKRTTSDSSDEDGQLEDASPFYVTPFRRKSILSQDGDFERLFKDANGIYRSEFSQRRSK